VLAVLINHTAKLDQFLHVDCGFGKQRITIRFISGSCNLGINQNVVVDFGEIW